MAIPTTSTIETRETLSLNPQVKVVVYRWEESNPQPDTPNSTLNRSDRLDISSQIMACTFSKNLANPAGSFQFTLSNSPNFGSNDWKDIIQRGVWVIIYFSQEGDLVINPEVGPPLGNATRETQRIRCIGYVDRVAVQSELNDAGAFDITYEVSGRDFGVVYQDSNIWANLFQFDKILTDRVRVSGLNVLGVVKLNEALDVMHDLLLYPSNIQGANVNDQNSLTSIGLQWLLPRELVTDVFGSLQLGGETFWGNLPGVKNFQTTEAALAINSPSDYLFGEVWGNLKQIAVPQLHELFTETDDNGRPRLTFRPIPWGIDKTGYPLQGRHVTLYKDLKPTVEVPSLQVINFDVGESGLELYNSFLVTVQTSLIQTKDNVSILRGTGFPSFNRASIKRYGFRPMHTSAHAIVKNGEQADGASHEKLLREFNHVLQDYYENAVFAESGTVQIVGDSRVKVGKTMTFGEGTPYLTGKVYYVESYVDQFTVGENGEREWVTSVFLTRGFERRDLLLKTGFGRRDETFVQRGEYTPSPGKV